MKTEQSKRLLTVLKSGNIRLVRLSEQVTEMEMNSDVTEEQFPEMIQKINGRIIAGEYLWEFTPNEVNHKLGESIRLWSYDPFTLIDFVYKMLTGK